MEHNAQLKTTSLEESFLVMHRYQLAVILKKCYDNTKAINN